MKTILVTGAAGFIGRRMSVAAQAAGWRVIGLDREVSRDAKPEGATKVADRRGKDGTSTSDDPTRYAVPETGATKVADLRGGEGKPETPSLASTAVEFAAFQQVRGCHGEAGCGPVGPQPDWIVADIAAGQPIELPQGIDAIIHLAGKAHALAEVSQDEAEYFRINTEGTRRMLEAAQRAGVRSFVLFSTVKAAGDGGEVKAAGDAPAEVTSDKGQVARGEAPNDQGLMPNDECGSGNVEGGALPSNCRPACLHALSQTGATKVADLRETNGACEHADLPGQTEAVRTQGPTLRGAALLPLDESCSAPPDTPYGQSKRAAEALVLDGGYVPHPVVLRPCLVYGPTPKGNLEKMIAAVRRGRFPPLPEVGNKRSMVHVDDVIAAALLAAEHPAAAGQIFIVADNEPFSTRQLFEWICKAAGRRVPGWTMPLWMLRQLGRIGDGIGRLRGRRFVFDSDALAKLTGDAWYSSAKLQRELGWKPTHTLRETMPDMVGPKGQ